jgi:molybdopterin-guanine dinucleotide biosynthesis protein A
VTGAQPESAPVTVLVLAGGESRRFGADKLSAGLRGTTVLDHLLSSLPPEWRVVAVGAPRETSRPVEWTREEPPGGGPLAGVAAGLELVTSDVLAVVAGDMPYAAAGLVDLVAALRDQPPTVGGVVGTDGDGVANPLLAAYRTAAVRGVLPHTAHGRPAKTLLGIPHVRLALRGDVTRDVDTRADLEDLR